MVEYYLQGKLLGYQRHSILTLLSMEEGKMFSNLTDAEKSQRGKGKGTSQEEEAGRKEKMNGKEEKRVEAAGIDKNLGNTRLFSL